MNMTDRIVAGLHPFGHTHDLATLRDGACRNCIDAKRRAGWVPTQPTEGP